MEIKPYSDKSFLLLGNTKEYKEEIKEFGGKWNSSLGGWIFSNKHLEKIQNWIQEKLTCPTPQLRAATPKITSSSNPVKSEENEQQHIFEAFCDYIQKEKIFITKEDLVNFNKFYNKNHNNPHDDDLDVYFDISNENESANKNLYFVLLDFFRFYLKNNKLNHSIYQNINKIKLLEHAYLNFC